MIELYQEIKCSIVLMKIKSILNVSIIFSKTDIVVARRQYVFNDMHSRIAVMLVNTGGRER